MLTAVRIGDDVFAQGEASAFGAVRAVYTHALSVYVEGFGDTLIQADLVVGVHDGRIIIDPAKLPAHVAAAIVRAHVRETE